jgi:AcrR family transcriptional regulator
VGNGASGKASARDTLVSATIAHLARYGPVGTQPQEICAELGISKALVNYHFGGREGLIAEAITVAYEGQSVVVEMAARMDDGVSASDTLERIIEERVQWAVANPGLAAAGAYPELAVGRSTFSDEQLARLHAAGERNFAGIETVVRAARAELTDGRPFDAEHEGRIMAAIVGWIMLGMVVWSSGTYLPTQHIQPAVGFDTARQHLHLLIREALVR